jgi:hypothetical protein
MENIQWLLENGGPAIRLRASSLHEPWKSETDADSCVSALLDIDEVQTLLNYFDAFQASVNDIRPLRHIVHYYKDTCIDNFFPLVVALGLRAGFSIFEEKMKPVKDTFKHIYTQRRESAHCYNYTIMLHMFFTMSGCLFSEVVESLENRLDALYPAAAKYIYDIYQDERKLPKKPKMWADVGVLKDEMNPWKITAESPLPTVYDIWAFAYYTKGCADPEKMRKINGIIAYILTPEFQNLREGYGLLWVKDLRRYHACGWNPVLPPLDHEGNLTQEKPYHTYVLDSLDFISHFKAAQESEWLHRCLRHFEQFKTDKGTYIFPKEYLHKRYIDKAFLNEHNLSLKRNERETMKRELVSTMKMAEIHRRLALSDAEFYSR